MENLFNPEWYNICEYFDEETSISFKKDATNHLQILSPNIRSLPKHGDELVCLLEVLETKFQIIVLTEIGSRNISTVEHISEHYQLYYVTPKEYMFGEVGIYVSEELINVHVWNRKPFRKIWITQ